MYRWIGLDWIACMYGCPPKGILTTFMYVCMYAWMDKWIGLDWIGCMYVCTYVRMYVCVCYICVLAYSHSLSLNTHLHTYIRTYFA